MFPKMLFWILVLKIASALPAGVYVDKGGNVGASWGGYSASAGLGGLVGGAGPRGGLHAQAGTPDGHFAAAGLGGSVSEGAGPQGQLYSTAGHEQPQLAPQPVVLQPVAVQPVAVQPVATAGSSSQASASASASASGSHATSNAASNSASNSGSNSGFVGGGVAPTPVHRRPGSFFDDIFNIPISTLGAVNQYLNNRHKVAAVPSSLVRVEPVQGSQSSSNAFASSSASSSSSSASSSADAGTPTGTYNNNVIYHGPYKGAPNYDAIFNIPISVLGAVNRLLNGKH